MLPVSWQAPVSTIAVAVLGAVVFAALSFPAPYLTGPATMVTLAGLVGMKIQSPPLPMRHGVFVILGLTIGQGVTPEVLDAMRTWPVTLTALAVSIFAIILLTRAMLVRYWSMDPTTAFLSSSPGHLSYVLGLTEGVKADLKTVSIVQSIRVLALTLLVPAVIALTGQLPERPAVGPEETALVPLVLMILCAAMAGYVLHRLKLPAAYLIGGMLVSVGLHVTGIVEGVMSYWLAAAAFVSLGTLIGSRFSGVTWQQLWNAMSAGVAVTLLGAMLAGICAVIAAEITGMDVVAVMIAFAPGGLETMAAMSVILGIDPTFVASHHVARLLILTVIVPFFVLRGKANKS